MKKLLTLLPVFLLATACTQSAPSADPSEIKARSEAWETALNAKDIEALVSTYAEDVRVMAPNEKSAIGREAARAAFGGMIDAGLTGTLTSVDTAVSGDIAYNVGVYTLLAGDDVVDTGKYMETWRRGGDGVWLMTNDIWNSDNPPTPPARPMANRPETHLLITHEVDDVERWLSAWRGEDSRHDLFKAHGARHVHTFTSADNPNLTGLVVAVEDLDALNAMLGSDEGMAAAAEDGVRGETLTILTEAD